ncbi:MAG: hypothetical protein JXA96_00975 [Sedimentisphaerales bacterium]|nr:hypothetical protein [Sedimentisphaerales bacterium]
MKKILVILFVVSFVSLSYAKTSKQTLLRDGIALKVAVGKLIASDSNDDTWFLELGSPITDNGIVINAGQKIELLPSSSLEMMIDNAKTHLPATYQLWNVKITKYKGKNYIFPSVFFPVHPLSEKQTSEKSDNVETSSEEMNKQNSDPVDPNEILSLPTEILEQFIQAGNVMNETGRRIPDTNFVTIDDFQQELERKRQLNPDIVLLDENAILVRDENSEIKFTLDTFGRNVDMTSLHLLPCEALEVTELKQSSSPESLRFKISGIVTKYKGNNYLLLYKATQIYSYGNFGK